MWATTHESLQRAARPMLTGVVMVFLFVWLFAAALHQPTPHEVPVALVAPASAAAAITRAIEAKSPGAFALTVLDSADAARLAIEKNEIDGAIVVSASSPRILVASASGVTTAAAITGAFTSVARALGQEPEVEDLEPLPASDSRGMVPFFLVLGVSVSAFIYQVLVRSTSKRASLGTETLNMVVFAMIDGLLAALAVGVAVGFHGHYWALAGICFLLAFAVAAATAACCRLFGPAGIGLAGLVLILLANASSGSVIGPDFLPQPFRWLSSILPAGPGLAAVRSSLYFDEASVAGPLGILALWVLCSFAVLASYRFWRRSAPKTSVIT